jgi:hypothetical protein
MIIELCVINIIVGNENDGTAMGNAMSYASKSRGLFPMKGRGGGVVGRYGGRGGRNAGRECVNRGSEKEMEVLLPKGLLLDCI